MAAWYTSSVGWTAVTAWAASTAYSVGDLRRQLAAPTAGNERVFRCTTAGTSGGTEPAWTLTKGATTNDGTAVWTEVTGDSTYGWTAPHASIAAASGWLGNGDTMYVSHQHAHTRAATLTISGGSSPGNRFLILCVNDGATPPTTLATTATESTTGNNALTFNSANYSYFYGITFNCGSGAVSARITCPASGNQSHIIFESCVLAKLGTTGIARAIWFQTTQPTCVELINTQLQFGATSDSIGVDDALIWRNTPNAVLGTVPTTLFVSNNAIRGKLHLLGVDLSAAGSGKTLVDISSNARSFEVCMEDCKLGASVAITTGSATNRISTLVDLYNCDSADTNYRRYNQTYEATMTHETTIVRSGGATDGTTPRSLKIVTTANSKFIAPYYSEWMPFWNESLASAITVAIPIITDNVTLTDAEAWIEVEGQTTSGFPLGGFANDRAADILATPANQTTDATSSWTTTGLATPVKQVLSTTITPQEKGWIRARVCVAKASTTVYFDPAPINGSWTKYATKARMHEGGVMQAEDASAGAAGLKYHPGMVGGFNA